MTQTILHENRRNRIGGDGGDPGPQGRYADAPNAFATGCEWEQAAVAVTASLMWALTPQELEGVMAHKLDHIKNSDTLISTLVASMAGAISMVNIWPSGWRSLARGAAMTKNRERLNRLPVYDHSGVDGRDADSNGDIAFAVILD